MKSVLMGLGRRHRISEHPSLALLEYKKPKDDPDEHKKPKYPPDAHLQPQFQCFCFALNCFVLGRESNKHFALVLRSSAKQTVRDLTLH